MHRNCPVCNFSEKEILSELCGNLKIMGPSFPDTSSNNVSCTNCGAVYVDTTASQNDFDNYYRSMARTIKYADAFGKENANEYFENIYTAIKSYINPNSQILDLGCGVGEFSEFLTAKGYENIIAADVSPTNVENAKKIGINAFVYNAVENNDDWQGKFDLIIFSHTVEHILDSYSAIQNVQKMLKENGILYLEVPDADKYCDVELVPYFFFTYEHLVHFTDETLKNLANIFALKLLQMKTFFKCNHYYVMYGIYQNSGVSGEVEREIKTAKAINKYEKMCRDNLKPVINVLEKNGNELILWGVGASTAQLLNGHFDNCNVVRLVDSNPNRQGIEFNIAEKKLKIEAPETIVDKTATIVVLPIMYKDSIIKQVRKSGLINEIVGL